MVEGMEVSVSRDWVGIGAWPHLPGTTATIGRWRAYKPVWVIGFTHQDETTSFDKPGQPGPPDVGAVCGSITGAPEGGMGVPAAGRARVAQSELQIGGMRDVG